MFMFTENVIFVYTYCKFKQSKCFVHSTSEVRYRKLQECIISIYGIIS